MKINISAKAYRDFTTRIRDTFAITDQPAGHIDLALRALDSYIAHTRTDFDDLPPLARLALLLLQPEIDKCLARSAAARARAASRRPVEGRVEKLVGSRFCASASASPAVAGTVPDDDLTLHLSRCERRAIERAARPRMKLKRLC